MLTKHDSEYYYNKLILGELPDSQSATFKPRGIFNQMCEDIDSEQIDNINLIVVKVRAYNDLWNKIATDHPELNMSNDGFIRLIRRIFKDDPRWVHVISYL